MNILYDAWAKAPGDVVVEGAGPLIFSLPVKEVEVGRLVLLTCSWEIHQGDQTGAVVVQVAPTPFVYGGAPANWKLGVSPLPAGFATPIEVAGTTVLAGQGWSATTSIYLEILGKTGEEGWELGMYGWAYPRGAKFMGGACEMRVRVLG